MIYRASKLQIRNASVKEERAFLETNHLQGYVHSDTCLGLYDKDELIELMSFGKSRFNKKYNTELLRLCTKKDCIVHGGASRLFKHYTTGINEPIISYCNESIFSGKVYTALGFSKLGTVQSYFYTKNGEVILRYQMQRNARLRSLGIPENIEKTITKFGGTYYPEKSERVNAELNGFEVHHKIEATWVWGAEWYVYEITNNINGKTYIGQHIKHDGKDSYMGSGTNIHRAIEKYGIENFSKRILVDNIQSKEDVDRIELEEINKAKAIGKAEYNIVTERYQPSEHHHSDDLEAFKQTMRETWTRDPEATELRKKHISEALKGRKMSETFREKTAKRMCGKSYVKGRKWYNNGVEQKLLTGCPEGWIEGRLPMTEEHKKAIVEAASKRRGRKQTIESVEKRRQSNLGKHRTDEQKKRIAEACRKHWTEHTKKSI